MTDEEMAEQFANSYATPDLEDSFRADMFEASKEGFLAGLKVGRQDNQLIKAKEIIKSLLPMASNFVFGTLPKLDEEVQLYRQAEHFLKEIE